MNADAQAKSKNQKPSKASGCCSAPAGLKIMNSVPILKASTSTCCDTPPGLAGLSGGASAETAQSPAAGNPAVFWPWGLGGLIGVLIFIFGAGIIPGVSPGVFWSNVLLHIGFVGKAAWSILPFFLASVGIAAWVGVSGLSERVKTAFSQQEKIAIAGAAVVGAALPLCSCGVIPLIAALLASGVPLGPVMAFWISSPLMSPSIFVLTAGVLGVDYAIARLFAAILMGAGAGYLIYALSSFGLLNNQLHGLSLVPGSCCASGKATQSVDSAGSKLWRKFGTEVWRISFFLGKWLLVAFILESLIVHYVDPKWIASAFGEKGWFSIPLATVIGIPVYTSGVGAIPIVHGLLKSGMGPGAAMAFLVAGPVTTIPAMTAVFALVRKKTFAIYLVVGIVGSLIAGYTYQLIAG